MTHTPLAQPELAAVEVRGMSRAAFLARGALTAGAVFGAGAVSPFVRQAMAQEGGDTDILNFALTLEYLEAAFYDRALEQVRGLSGETRKLASELRDNEHQHVDTLTATIRTAGAKPVQAPAVDFGRAFSSEDSFLRLAQTFEDTGVGAYNGAAPMIRSDQVLKAAGGIAQVEARHASLIRLMRGATPAPRAFDEALQKDQVLKAVQPFVKGAA